MNTLFELAGASAAPASTLALPRLRALAYPRLRAIALELAGCKPAGAWTAERVMGGTALRAFDNQVFSRSVGDQISSVNAGHNHPRITCERGSTL